MRINTHTHTVRVHTSKILKSHVVITVNKKSFLLHTVLVVKILLFYCNEVRLRGALTVLD